MCGIVAIYSTGEPVSVTQLQLATEALRHRGPEGQCTWTAPDGRVGLGHTRLSIASAEGDQPIASEDKNLRLVVNGEFYDYESSRRSLEARGHQFQTPTDSEIALHLYEDMQAACLEQLRGEFAFILWDERTETLFAARDRFGIKPLFYAQLGDQLYLASEAKALFAAGVPAAWDHESVFQSLYVTARLDRSLFQGVRQVPPGHILRATRHGVRLESYWDVSYPRRGRPESRFPKSECLERVQSLLAESIRLRMRAHAPVGYLVSGGLDSSAMLGMASSYSDKPLTAFSIGFNSEQYDESPRAREMARHAGAEHHVLALSETELADHFAESVWHGEGIQYNAHGTARFLLSQTISRLGYRAVMGGEGADEGFAGYGFLRGLVVPRGSPGIWPKWLKYALRFLRPMNGNERLFARTSPWLAYLSKLFAPPAEVSARALEWLQLFSSMISAEHQAQFKGRDPYREFFSTLDFRAKLLGREPAKQILYLWLRSVFVNYHMAADRLDMAHAVEVRLPFLDHKLFEYVSQIPVSVLAKGGQQKYLLRELGRPYIPDSVYSGAKKPFWAPPSTLQVGNKLYKLIQETLRSSAMASVPFFDQKAVVAVLDQLPMLDDARRAALDPILMTMVSMCFLHQRYRL